MAKLQSTNVIGALCVNGVAIGGGKDFKYCCFTGSTTWTPPSDLVTGDGVVDALLVGGGGGGGGMWKGFPGGTQCCVIGTGGGGGGGTIKALLTMTSSNDACTITIGAAGGGGKPTDNDSGVGRECNGCDGGNTIFGNSGSGSDSAIAFGGAGGGRRAACHCSGSCYLFAGGGGDISKGPSSDISDLGGNGASSTNPVKVLYANSQARFSDTNRENVNFIQGYAGGAASTNCCNAVMAGEGIIGYGQSYYVDPDDSSKTGFYFPTSGSIGWGSGGTGGIGCIGATSNFAALGGGIGGQNQHGTPANGCGGGGGGAGSPKLVSPTSIERCGGDGAPGIMIIKWQQ